MNNRSAQAWTGMFSPFEEACILEYARIPRAGLDWIHPGHILEDRKVAYDTAVMVGLYIYIYICYSGNQGGSLFKLSSPVSACANIAAFPCVPSLSAESINPVALPCLAHHPPVPVVIKVPDPFCRN